MSDIGWGLLLNLLFWVLVISALVFAAVWASVELFLGASHRIRKGARAMGGRKESPNPSSSYEEDGDRYRKAS